MLEIFRTVKITYNAEWWELLDGPLEHDREQAEEAARDINEAIMAAVNSGASRNETGERAYAVMQRWANVGATDSEPFYHLRKLLDKIYGD